MNANFPLSILFMAQVDVPKDQFFPVPPGLVHPLGAEVPENGSEAIVIADEKIAWATIFPEAEAIIQGLAVPEQAPPLQPIKTDPTFGTAVRLSVLPCGTGIIDEQIVPQEIP